jgi:general secretion pathway protein D
MKPILRTAFDLSAVFLIVAALLAPWPVLAQTAQEKKAPSALAIDNADQLVSIDFNNVDIGVFIKFMSDLTKQNFVVDEKVRGRVTVISPGRITVAEAYQVFESVLEVHGLTPVPAGAITKIVPAPEARAKNIKTRIEEEAGVPGDSVITQIVPLRYADPNEIKNLFTPLVSRNSVIQAYPPTNTLIITDVHSNISRLLTILKAIDITGVGQQIALIPVENASATKLVTMLQSIFRSAKERGTSEKEIIFVADERTNMLIALASEGDLDNIRQLVKSLDKATPRGQGNINVYYLEHAASEDLVKVLQEVVQNQRAGEHVTPDGRTAAPMVSSQVRITADKPTNSLIIMADTDEYLILESIIKQIDIPRSMVYIEALIMEVNVTKNFQLGTEWQIGAQTSHNGKEAIYGGGFKADPDRPLIGMTPRVSPGQTTIDGIVPTLPAGLAMGIFGEALTIAGISFPSIAAVIQAYAQDRDVRILSTPQILTTDNQEASIYVGRNLPFQTTATASTTGTEIFNSFEYRDVGKSLKITPQISKDRMVRLLISLEVTALESVTDTRPTTLKRTIETTAIVQDGHTVVLGGLIDDNEGSTRTKVPCLGDIPGFGALFSSRSTAFEKSNLYVFLTPRVIQDADEARKVSKHKRDEIDNRLEQKIKLYNTDRPIPPLEDLQIPPPENKERSMQVPPEPSPEPSASTPRGALSADEISPAASDSEASLPRKTASLSSHAEAAPASALASDRKAAPDNPSGAIGVQGYTLQVAALQNQEAAAELLTQLTAKGYAAYIVRTEENGQTWFRVRIGYFARQQDAQAVVNQLRTDRHNPVLIKL